MSAMINDKAAGNPEQTTQAEPSAKVVPPLIGAIRDTKDPWITSAGEALCRFPSCHFITLAVMGALVGVAWLITREGQALTALGLIGALSVGLLVCGFGFVALYMSRNDGQTKQEHPDKPPQPGNGN